MQFTGSNAGFVADGQGGRFLQGTFELTILEATGIYKPFVSGHNHMVDKLHFLAPGDGSGGIDEYCFCFISRQVTSTLRHVHRGLSTRGLVTEKSLERNRGLQRSS